MNPQAKKRRLEDPADFLPASTSFEKMMKDKTFFADKSSLIPFIEEDRNVIFCRPSRFGKSLILQMLMAYFDKKTDDAKFTAVCLSHCFSYCYNSLWIGGKDGNEARKTNLQCKFIILPLDFSAFVLDAMNLDQFLVDFKKYIVQRVKACASRYSLALGSADSPAEALKSLKDAAGETQVYVFIDEYDTPFAKIVLGSALNMEQKETTLARLRESYNSVILSIKSAQFRLFMTGILDIAFSGLSGMSFSRTTFEPGWHTLSGFTEDDVKLLLQTVSERLPEDDPCRDLLSQEQVVNNPQEQNDKRTALERLRAAYNGYWFGRTHDDQPAKMYNADMVLYFVRFILSDGRFPENSELIDPKASISNKILKFAGSLPWLGGASCCSSH